MMQELKLDNIALSIDGRELFAPLSLAVPPATVTAVTGPSGSGKSSMLKFLCGILPDGISGSGRVRIGTDELSDQPPQRRGLGLLFQESAVRAAGEWDATRTQGACRRRTLFCRPRKFR